MERIRRRVRRVMRAERVRLVEGMKMGVVAGGWNKDGVWREQGGGCGGGEGGWRE